MNGFAWSKGGVSHEDIYLVKRFPLQSNANKMHKDYLGRLAFQDNLCASCLCRISGKTFGTSECLRATPPFDQANPFARQPFWHYELQNGEAQIHKQVDNIP